jgi:hypothetical protein
VFTKNRDRLIEGDIARKFVAAVLSQGSVKALLSDDHFSIDGTLIEAWASMKSFRPKDDSSEPPAAGRNRERDFHGEKRSNPFRAANRFFPLFWPRCWGITAGGVRGALASLRRTGSVSGPWLGFSPRARRRVRPCPCR